MSAATAGAAAAAWLWWLPGAVAARAHELIARRTGVPVQVGGASVGLGSVVLENLRIGDAVGGISVQVAAVRLSGGPLAWLVSGASGVERVEATGVGVEVDLTRPEALRTLARWRTGTLTATGTGPGRDVLVEGVRLRVHDAFGTLVDVQQGYARRESGRLSAGARELLVGSAPGDVASLRELEVELERIAGERRVKRARVGGGRMVWAARDELADGGEHEPLATARRLEAAWVSVTGRAQGAASVTGGARESAGPGGGALTSAAAGGEQAAVGLAMLSPTGSLAVSGLEIATRGPEGEKTVLRGLEATLQVAGRGRFRAVGAGTGAPSGTVRWDVELRPEELRAEGSLGLEGVPLALLLPLLPDAPLHRPEDARIDAELVVRGEGLTTLALEGRVRVSDAAVASARVAPDPVRGISFEVQGQGAFVPAERRLEIASARISVGPDAGRAAVANLAGTLEWAPDHYLFDVQSTLPPTPCGAAIGAIPSDLLAELRGLSFSGTLAGRAHVRVDSRDLDATRVEIGVQDGCAFETVPALADLRRFEGPFMHHVVEPDGTTFEMETGPGTAEWTPIAEISPYLMHAVLAHEDGAFFRHHGFAPGEIQVALVRNLRARRYVQGASTITMQLVKNLFLHREKTLARKVQEVLLTWWIERVLDKAHILELYLNVIEYGPSVYGIRQAAWHYFGRTPAELSPAESAFLATILPNPKAFHSAYVDGTLSPRMAERLRAFLRRMFARGRIDQAALDGGLAEVDAFAFHREGAERPAPRALPGRAQALPFDLPETSLDAWGDDPTGASADDAARWYEADGTEGAPVPAE